MRILLILTLLFSTACSAGDTGDSSNNEVAAFHILLSDLLGINQEKYTYIDAAGKPQTDELRMFKELEQVYIEYIEPDLKDGSFSDKRLKVIQFFAFYAEQKKSAALQEYLASDLMPVYQKDPVHFLQTLNELPFLIAPSCDRLNAYFGFEGKNVDKKPEFMNDNRKLIEKYLGMSGKDICLDRFAIE